MSLRLPETLDPDTTTAEDFYKPLDDCLGLLIKINRHFGNCGKFVDEYKAAAKQENCERLATTFITLQTKLEEFLPVAIDAASEYRPRREVACLYNRLYLIYRTWTVNNRDLNDLMIKVYIKEVNTMIKDVENTDFKDKKALVGDLLENIATRCEVILKVLQISNNCKTRYSVEKRLSTSMRGERARNRSMKHLREVVELMKKIRPRYAGYIDNKVAVIETRRDKFAKMLKL